MKKHLPPHVIAGSTRNPLIARGYRVKRGMTLLMAVLFAATSLTAQTWDCGANDNNVTATLANGTLTISGTGAMADYNPNSANTLSPWSAKGSSITTVVVESGVTTLGNAAFYNCYNSTSITLPESLTAIGAFAFSNCNNLTSVTLPDGVTSIGEEAFRGCTKLSAINLPESITSIDEYAFANCPMLTSISLPGKLTTIGNGMFTHSGLTAVTIPNGVTTIGESAFEECTALTDVTCLSLEPPTMGRFVFDHVDLGSATLMVPAASVDKYKAASLWKNFGTIEATDAVSTDATLKSLTVAWNAFAQTFEKPISLTPDTLYVSPSTESITLSAVQNYPSATVSGTGAQPLSEGSNAFPVKVTAEDETTTQTYTVVVVRTENPAPLHAKIEALVADTARLFALVGTLTENNTQLVLDTAFLGGNNRDLTANLADALAINDELNDTLTVRNTTIGFLERDTLRLSTLLSDCQTNSDELNGTIGTLQTQKQTLSENNAKLVSDTARLYDLVAMLDLENEELNDSIVILLQRLAECESGSSASAQMIPQEQISVYPNPVNYELRITNYEFKAGDVVELYDMNGKRVYSARVETWRAASLQPYTIDMSPYQSGNYILKIGNRIAKVVKQ